MFAIPELIYRIDIVILFIKRYKSVFETRLNPRIPMGGGVKMTPLSFFSNEEKKMPKRRKKLLGIIILYTFTDRMAKTA